MTVYRDQGVRALYIDQNDADLLFREDARRLGYLEPWGGGIGAYYTDHGMVSPRRLQEISSRELTNTDELLDLTLDEPGQFPQANPLSIAAANDS